MLELKLCFEEHGLKSFGQARDGNEFEQELLHVRQVSNWALVLA